MTGQQHVLLRIFWPSDAPKSNLPGVLVGWKNSELDIVVISVLEGVEAHNVEHALRVRALFRNSPHALDSLLEQCGGRIPLVLGTICQQQQSTSTQSMLALEHGKPPLVKHDPELHFSTQFISFDRPDPRKMQYLSLTPISLALHDQQLSGSVDKDEEAERTRIAKLIEKLKQHTVVRHARTQKELALPILISQINCSAEINDLMQSNVAFVGIRAKRSMSVSEKVVESATDLHDQVNKWAWQKFERHVSPTLTRVLILWLVVQRTIAEILLILINWRAGPDYAAIRDISATAQQLDIRLQQFSYWPVQYITLHHRREDWHSVTNSHTEYIRFFNSLWLVANDVIIGIALGSYLVENAEVVATQLNSLLDTYTVTGLQNMITWLMDYPAGLKLNNELAAFLGDLFLWVIGYWAGCIHQLQPAFPYLVRIIGLSSFAGASLAIAMFSDFAALLTIHVYSFYIASARIYNWQLTIILSLFHLFRGKKRNILRRRIDNCDYDLDQLLLGTILFTVLFFLLPTVAVFYATFAGARMGIIALKAVFDTCLACLNHFPLFAIMLRFKDSRRLPGGIRFELLSKAVGPQSSTAYLQLQVS